MLLFERLQLAHQPVVLGVGDFRIVEHVVAIVVMLDLPAQLTHSGCGAAGHADVAAQELDCRTGRSAAPPLALGGRSNSRTSWRMRSMRWTVSGTPRSSCKRAAETLLQATGACDQLIERMHARHRSGQLREQRDAGIVHLAHLLEVERAGLDHARDAEDAAAVGVQAMEDVVLAVLQRLGLQRLQQLRARRGAAARPRGAARESCDARCVAAAAFRSTTASALSGSAQACSGSTRTAGCFGRHDRPASAVVSRLARCRLDAACAGSPRALAATSADSCSTPVLTAVPRVIDVAIDCVGTRRCGRMRRRRIRRRRAARDAFRDRARVQRRLGSRAHQRASCGATARAAPSPQVDRRQQDDPEADQNPAQLVHLHSGHPHRFVDVHGDQARHAGLVHGHADAAARPAPSSSCCA